MNNYTFDELVIGMKESFQVTVTQAMMEQFYNITGDSNMLHNKKEFAKEKGFSDVVVYGMLTASFLSTLAGVYMPGENSLIQKVEINFTKPVFVGDELTISGEVVEMFESVQMIVMKVIITNQNAKKVLRATMDIKVT